MNKLVMNSINPVTASSLILVFLVIIGLMLTLIAVTIYKLEMRLLKMEKRLDKLIRLVHDSQSKWSCTEEDENDELFLYYVPEDRKSTCELYVNYILEKVNS